MVFQACTNRMNLHEEVDLEDFVARPEKISAADIAVDEGLNTRST